MSTKRSATPSYFFKVSLNSDGQHFHEYQKIEQSPFAIIEHNRETPRHMTKEIHILAWDGHKHVAGLNRLMESQPSSLEN